jgi:hypothetical protein
MIDFGDYKGMARDGFEPPTQGFSVLFLLVRVRKVALTLIP